jgi:hypothetical protein
MGRMHGHGPLPVPVATAAAAVGGDAGASWRLDELFDAWEAARQEARDAYGRWTLHPGRDAYATYRACQDRADAAQDTVAGEARGLGRR